MALKRHHMEPDGMEPGSSGHDVPVIHCQRCKPQMVQQLPNILALLLPLSAVSTSYMRSRRCYAGWTSYALAEASSSRLLSFLC
jgi:hypothetical protein